MNKSTHRIRWDKKEEKAVIAEARRLQGVKQLAQRALLAEAMKVLPTARLRPIHQTMLTQFIAKVKATAKPAPSPPRVWKYCPWCATNFHNFRAKGHPLNYCPNCGEDIFNK